MQYRQLGKSGEKVSSLCIGTSLFGDVTSEVAAADILSAASDSGINFIDTAPAYAGGRAEEVLGRLLAKVRNQWFVGTKVSAGNSARPEEGLNRAWITASVDRSLARLKTDRIDLLYLHRHDARATLEETIGAMGELINTGKVRFFGFSNYSGWQIGEIIRLCDIAGLPRPVAAQPYYNMVTRAAEADYLPACTYYGIGVVPYSALARGVLTGKYEPAAPPAPDSRAGRGDKRMLESAFLPEVLLSAQKIKAHAEARGMTSTEFALAWLLAHKSVASVLMGARNREQMMGYLSALKHELNDADELAVDAIVSPGHHPTPGYNDPLYPIAGRRT